MMNVRAMVKADSGDIFGDPTIMIVVNETDFDDLAVMHTLTKHFKRSRQYTGIVDFEIDDNKRVVTLKQMIDLNKPMLCRPMPLEDWENILVVD